MVELSNTKVHTSFKHISGEVEISGNATVGKNDVVENMNGTIKKGEIQVCTFSAYKPGDNELQYNFNSTNITLMCEVIPALSGIEASIISELQKADA